MSSESIADLLSSLQFESSPVETIYRNAERIHDDFIGQLGAVGTFARRTVKKGSVRLPVMQIGGGVDASDGITWNMQDPTAQALVLRAALESQGLLHGPDQAEPGRYVAFAGRGLLSRPEMLQADHRAALRRWPGLFDRLEADRANQEQVEAFLSGDDPERFFLMSVDDGTSIVGGALRQRWLSAGLPSWLGGEASWNVFGKVRAVVEHDVPQLAVLHVMATWDTN